jgi:hypothetical protein
VATQHSIKSNCSGELGQCLRHPVLQLQ